RATCLCATAFGTAIRRSCRLNSTRPPPISQKSAEGVAPSRTAGYAKGNVIFDSECSPGGRRDGTGKGPIFNCLQTSTALPKVIVGGPRYNESEKPPAMAVKSDPDMGINSWLEDELYQQYLRDRSSVDEGWKQIFEDGRTSAAPRPSNGAPPAPAPAPQHEA